MQWRRAFVTALLPDRVAHDCFMPVTTYGTEERTFGPKLPPHRRFVTVGTRWKIARAVKLWMSWTIVVGREVGPDGTSKWTGAFSVSISTKAPAYRGAMSPPTSWSPLSTAALKMTRRDFAGHPMWSIQDETLGF